MLDEYVMNFMILCNYLNQPVVFPFYQLIQIKISANLYLKTSLWKRFLQHAAFFFSILQLSFRRKNTV